MTIPRRLALSLLPAVLLFSTILTANAQPKRLGTIDADLIGITVAPGNRIILTDRSGGKRDKGSVFELRDDRFTTLHSFRGYDGATPTQLVTVGRRTYGITTAGGRHNRGTLFEVTRSRVRILHHFAEESGGARTIKADGGTLYGACTNGGYIYSNRRMEFRPLSTTTDVARMGNTLYALRAYYSSPISQLDRDTDPIALPSGDENSWGSNQLWIPHKRDILSVTSYGGEFAEGAVRLWNPRTNTLRHVFNFQSFNGGNPTTAALSPRGTLFTGNAEGIWKIAKRPKKISSITPGMLHCSGRNLYVIRKQLFQKDEIWFLPNTR